MFNDILGSDGDDEIKIDKDDLIESLKYNLKEKEKLINDLINEITKLERQLEDSNHSGIAIADPGI